MNQLGMIRVAAASPKLQVANTVYNTDEIIRCIREAAAGGAGLVLFPELAITGYTCGDLFYQDLLYQQCLAGLQKITESTRDLQIASIVGCYLRIENNLYNCAALIQGGQIRGFVPKMFMPNAREFYEARWFASGMHIAQTLKSVTILGQDIPFGHLIFHDQFHDLKLGIEICEDLWMPISPGSHMALNGVHILFNPSASNETVGKSDYRHSLVLQTSARTITGYIYASSGVHESTTDLVFGGDCIIAENGTALAEGTLFQRDSAILYGDLDYDRLRFERTYGQNFEQCTSSYSHRTTYATVPLSPLRTLEAGKDQLQRQYAKNPFLPDDPKKVDQRCREIFSIQTAGLAKRILHTNSQKMVLGISGGLDSTLALLVCAETARLLGKDPGSILAITMPGLGTTDKTYQNALSLMKLLGVQTREISIRDSVLKHFADISHDSEQHDTTYENAQARERTQILMDVANKEGGLVVGTGDLSEIALGWSTYNGDHMSMYGVNAGVPKTLVRFVIQWFMDQRLSGPEEEQGFSQDNAALRATLQDILETPISPELLPPDAEGNIVQKTEEKVGPYQLHDFFLFYAIRYGTPPKKLLAIATQAYAGEYEEEFIKGWLKVFYRRFFTQQFKRSCMPDGPKVGSVSLSPRGDWRMPSDADASLWLAELE